MGWALPSHSLALGGFSQREAKVEVVIWGYFDESGQLASDYICLCGFVSDERWDRFVRAWGGELKRQELPFLHLSPLMHREPPYHEFKWDDTHRDAVLRRVVKI